MRPKNRMQRIRGVSNAVFKTVLCMKSSTCNVAVYAETGRFPLYLRTKLTIIKYYFK